MTEVIAMLTNNDQTVPNAADVFLSAHAAPTNFWGFKDTGTTPENARDLASLLRNHGKTIVFESFGESESECLTAAEFAIENKCRYLIGCGFHESVVQALKGSDVLYLPTIGGRSGVPRVLYGTIEEIVSDGERVIAAGAEGVCLSMYRYQDGSAEKLANSVIASSPNTPTIVTGSINNFERLKHIRHLAPWGFTVGTAFFEEAFGTGLDWNEQIAVLHAVLAAKAIQPPTQSGMC